MYIYIGTIYCYRCYFLSYGKNLRLSMAGLRINWCSPYFELLIMNVYGLASLKFEWKLSRTQHGLTARRPMHMRSLSDEDTTLNWASGLGPRFSFTA
jgi:hypothetical protein